MLSQTWAPGALAVTYNRQGPVSASAQRAEDGSRVVVRLANSNGAPALVAVTLQGCTAQPSVRLTTLAGSALTQTNTPANPNAIVPVVSSITLGATGGNVTLPPYSTVALESAAA